MISMNIGTVVAVARPFCPSDLGAFTAGASSISTVSAMGSCGSRATSVAFVPVTLNLMLNLMSKHRWQTYEEHNPDFVGDEDVYMFAYRGGEYHNGPLCMTCGRTGCVHCDRQMLIEECPGAAQRDGLVRPPPYGGAFGYGPPAPRSQEDS